jgi:hypothetical protein
VKTTPIQPGDEQALKVFIHKNYWLFGKKERAIELLTGAYHLSEKEAKQRMKDMDKELKEE